MRTLYEIGAAITLSMAGRLISRPDLCFDGAFRFYRAVVSAVVK